MPPLHEHHRTHLQESGLSDETIVRAGLRSIDAREAQAHGYARGVAGLLIPYHHTSIRVRGRDLPYTRLRVEPELRRSPGQKYESPLKQRIQAGLNFHIYMPPGVDQLRRDRARPILVTEGEKKALKLTQEGLPALGLGGVWMFADPGQAQGSPQDLPPPRPPPLDLERARSLRLLRL